MKNKFKLILGLILSVFLTPSFAVPCQPINGCDGIANNNANTETRTAPINLPADINLQNAYNHGNSIGLVTGGLQILDPSAVEQWNIFTEEGNDYIIQTGNTFIANTTGDIVPNTAFFQVASTTQGSIPAPAMTSMQETAIVSPAQGSQVFNTTNNTLDYFDNSAEKHVLLAIDKIVQGANMIVTPNSNGTVTLASTGGSGSTTQVQGTFTAASTSTTSVGTSDTPINIASPLYFNVINSVGTSVTTASVSGVTTPIIQNTSAGGRWGIARFDLTMSFATLATPTTFAFTVYTNTGATTFFKNVTLPTQSSSNQEIGFASPLVYLNTGDYMYLTVSVASGSAAFTTRNFEGSWVDTTVASLPTTDALAQGTLNKYLSDDGGSTYQNLSGSATVGNLSKFNSTGGQLIDSGIAALNVVQNNGSTYNLSISGNASTVTNGIYSTGSYADPSWITSLAGSKITGSVAPGGSAGGDLTGTYPNPTIILNGITYAKFQQIVANSLFGNPTGSTANGQAISLGATLTFSGSALQTTAFTGDFTTPANSFVSTLATVNSNVGSFGDSTHTVTETVNGKGLITAVSSNLITPAGIGSPQTNGTGATGTWGINISGNAATSNSATTSGASTTITTTPVSTNAFYYLLFSPFATSSNQAVNLNSGIYANPSTDALTATTFIGALSGNASTATTATNANNFFTTVSGANASLYPILVTSAGASYQAANLTSGFSVNPSTGTVTATTFSGALNGNATTATDATGFFTTAVSNNAPFYPILVNQTTNSYQTANLNSGFSINPSTGTVTASTFSGALSGTATNANNVATTQVSTNASYYPLLAASSTNSNQAPDIGTGLTFNPSTNTLSTNAMSLSSLTLRSVLYTSASAGIIGDSSNFVYDGSGHNLYVGTNNISTLNGHGRLNLLGADATTNNSQTFYTSTDLYPLIQIAPYQHDNVLLNFDSYFSSGWVSSSSSSSFQFAKTSSALNLNYGVAAQGAALTWTTGISLSKTGSVSIPILTSSNLVTTDGSNNLASSNTLSSTVLGNIPKVTITTFAGGASGNYTPPAGCTSIIVRGWGSGAGGGGVAGAAASAGAAGGGGSGGYFLSMLTAPFGGAPFAYSVGSGGAGGAAGANVGSNGADTTFGSFTAGHGIGGTASTAGVSIALVGGGNITAGSGSSDILTPGMSGLAGIVLSSTVASAGYGGNAPAGGSGGRVAVNGNGSAGDIPGGGGGGAAGTNATNRAGGNGADGKLLIYEYYNG